MFRPARPRRAVDQIVDQVEGLLRDGTLTSGDRLPSERVLAEQFDVSRNTVREALRILEFTGMLVLKRGSSGGAFVAHDVRGSVTQSMVRVLRSGAFSRADLLRARDTVSAIEADDPVLRVLLRSLEEIAMRGESGSLDRGVA
ncbi:FadR/GntR family transcriptional regulator [Actinomadura sp. LOL_016]|uniref:FadR/GntR family transcriptional regulator n=1 Tax=unclassified Actinomadura TaxID=2626254 RepID=UPI003A8112C5